MNVLASFKVALVALKVNTLRSFLAMLGVIIGVASVIVMVSVASGAGEAIEARIKALGTNVLVIMPGSFTSGGRRAGEGTALALSEGDLAAIRSKVPSVAGAAGMVSGSAPLVVGNANWTTSVNGVNADFNIRPSGLSASISARILSASASLPPKRLASTTAPLASFRQ